MSALFGLSKTFTISAIEKNDRNSDFDLGCRLISLPGSAYRAGSQSTELLHSYGYNNGGGTEETGKETLQGRKPRKNRNESRYRNDGRETRDYRDQGSKTGKDTFERRKARQ